MVEAFVLLAAMVSADPADPYARCPLIRVAANGPELRVGMPRRQVETLVGKPERTELGGSEYLSQGFALIYDKSDRLAAVFGGESSTPGRLSEAFSGSVAGVAMGASRSDIEILFGKPDEVRSEAGVTFLKYAQIGLVFSLTEGRVHHLFGRQVLCSAW